MARPALKAITTPLRNHSPVARKEQVAPAGSGSSQFESGPGPTNTMPPGELHSQAAGVDSLMHGSRTKRRTPPKPQKDYCKDPDLRLALFDEIRDNTSAMGADGATTPPPPNQDGGVSSTMITNNCSTATAPSQPRPRKTYPQDWSAYNAAQTSEKDTFMEFLAALCAGIPQPKYSFGRPRLPMADMVYTGVMKVYSGFSARRFDCDVREARQKGYIGVAPSFNSVNRYIADPKLTPIITDLTERSVEPLKTVETRVAVDSSGFSTCRFARWVDQSWGKEKSQRHWLKAHIVAGTRTNIITSVKVTASNVHDSKMLSVLLDITAKRFTIREVCADKAYLSEANLQHIEDLGAHPYIPFKSNTTGQGSPMWKRLFADSTLNQEVWEDHYHQRSNVETTFSMVKASSETRCGPSPSLVKSMRFC